MTIKHHPSDATLVAYAAGNLPDALALVVATHLSACTACRGKVAEAESVGGVILEDIVPAPVAPGAMDRVLARLDDPEPPPSRPSASASGVNLPAPLAAWLGEPLQDSHWRRLAPGIRQVELVPRSPRGGNARLFRIAPGTSLPHHGHAGTELTLVLHGSFSDELGRFMPGDVAETDEDIRHQPIADSNVECVCLIATEAPLRFTGIIGRLLQPLVRL